LSVLVDTVDITKYVQGIKPGRGFIQSSAKYDLALKPGSYVYSKMAPGTSFSLGGRLFAGSMAALRTLIGNMHLWLRPRDEDYRIDYNGAIFYARIVSFTVAETNEFDTVVEWEAQFMSERPVAVGATSTLLLAQDTIVEFMNSGPGVTYPVLNKVTPGAAITFEMSDREGAIKSEIAGMGYSATDWGAAYLHGVVTYDYEYKLTDAPRCLKWYSEAGHSGVECGLNWNITSLDLSAEKCYTLWFALLMDKDLLTSARVGLGDGTNIGYATITARISDGIWSWIPVFVEECKNNNASLDTAAITRIYILFTPNSSTSLVVWLDGGLIVRNPAKVALATTAYGGFYNTFTAKFTDKMTGAEIDPTLTLQGKPYTPPGCTLFYQNSSASEQRVYVRSAV
jgi:hypothetical protein